MAETGPAGASSDAAERREQRAHARFKVDGGLLALGKPGLLTNIGFGFRQEILVNLSEGGVLALVGKRLKEGSLLRLRVEIPKWKDVIACEGEVRWCAQSARADTHFYVGFAFRGLAPGDAKRIAQMRELSGSVEYRVKAAARKEASSVRLQPPKV